MFQSSLEIQNLTLDFLNGPNFAGTPGTFKSGEETGTFQKAVLHFYWSCLKFKTILLKKKGPWGVRIPLQVYWRGFNFFLIVLDER